MPPTYRGGVSLILKRFYRDRRGFGHFIALGMGVAAALVLFGFVWPAAKTMMGSTVTSMESLNSQMDSTLNGLTVSATGTTILLSFPAGYTPSATSSAYSVTVNGSSDAVSFVSVSGQTATVTVTTAMSSGSTVAVTYTSGSTTYTGAGTAS